MEWLWVVAFLALILGPIIWVFIRERGSTGAPSHEVRLDQTGVAGEPPEQRDHGTRSRHVHAARARSVSTHG